MYSTSISSFPFVMFSAAIGNRIITVTNWEKQVTKMYHLLVTASETDAAAIGSSQIAMI